MKKLFTSVFAAILALSANIATADAAQVEANMPVKSVRSAHNFEVNRSGRHRAVRRAAEELLVSESFSKMTQGSVESPVAIETDEDYCIPTGMLNSHYGWGGFLLSQAGGQLYITGGTEDDYGMLWTPVLPDGGTYNITFEACIPGDDDSALDYVIVDFFESDEYMSDENYQGDYDFDFVTNQWQTYSFDFTSVSPSEDGAWMQIYTEDYSDLLVRNVEVKRVIDDSGSGETPLPGEGIVIVMADGSSYFGDKVGTWTTQGITITADSKGGNSNPVVNANSNDLRIYANGTLTISSSLTIKSISMALSEKGVNRISNIAVNTGSIVKQGANPLVWTGSAKSVTFTVGDSSIGAEAGKAGQLDFTTLTIVTSDEAGDPDPEDPEQPDDPEPGVSGNIYTGLVDNADDWEIETSYPEDGSYEVWRWENKYGLKASGFYDKAAQETEGGACVWVDLTGYKDCKLTFDHAVNYLDMKKYDREWFLEVYAYDETAETVDDLVTLPVNWPTGTDWTYVSSGDVDLTAFDGAPICLELYYYSGPTEDDENGPNVAATWEVKNFVVTGTSVSGVSEVIFDSSKPAEYFNLNGVRVERPAHGLYIMRQGDKSGKVLVK